MATKNPTTNTVFNDTRSAGRPIDQFRGNREEWWLNVNYAETIDMKDAISRQAIRTTTVQ